MKPVIKSIKRRVMKGYPYYRITFEDDTVRDCSEEQMKIIKAKCDES